MLSRIYKRDLFAKKVVCEKCGSRMWAVTRVWFVFWKRDWMYCEKCGATKYLTYEDFKKINLSFLQGEDQPNGEGNGKAGDEDESHHHRYTGGHIVFTENRSDD